MKRTVVAQQGEVKVFKIDVLPSSEELTLKVADGSVVIISHSESGNHHVLDADAVEVLERKSTPEGMKVLYAIVKNSTALKQDAAVPHDVIPLDPGLYELRIAREYDPFAEVARRVAD